MQTESLAIERIWIDSEKSFDDVLAGFSKHISRPNITEFNTNLTSAQEYSEIQEIVRAATGPSSLMEFNRFPLGELSRHDPAVKRPTRMVRIIAGNPVIMQSMARYVPEVGSYTPVTILVFERNGQVRLRYDKLSSLIASYGSVEALEIAKNLDEKIIRILTEVA